MFLFRLLGGMEGGGTGVGEDIKLSRGPTRREQGQYNILVRDGKKSGFNWQKHLTQ